MKVLTSEILQKPQDQVNQRPPTARARLAAIGTDGDPHGVHGLGRVADWPPPLPEGEVEVWNGPVTAEKAREAQNIWKSVSNDPKYSGVAEDWIKYWQMKEAGAAYSQFSKSSSIIENFVEAYEVVKSEAGNIVNNIGIAAINEINNKLNKIQFDLDSITGNVVGFVNKLDESYNLSRDYIDSKIESSWLENSLRPYLYFNDFSVSGISTIARGVGSLPSALAHPIDSFTGMIDGAALAIDRALVAENTPASVQAARAYSTVSNMSGREISTSLGNVGGEVVLLVGPGKLKGPLRFEARAYDIAAERGAAGSTSLWARAEVNGSRVYQRSDLIDPGAVDALGRSNLQRMESGLAPIGPDGKSINLHHMLQTNDGPLAEVTQTFHQQYSSTLHINPNTIPSGIDRSAFKSWRSSYWQTRAGDFRQ